MRGILKWLMFAAVLLFAVPSQAQEFGSVFGAPPQVCVDGSCGKQGLLPSVVGTAVAAPVRIVQWTAITTGRIVQGTTVVANRAMQSTVGMVGAVVNLDSRAYAHALREAQIQADRGRVGHYLGCAPGTRFSGVGNSFSTNQPNHCKTSGTIVARAYAIGRDGRVYWSAHYK